MITKSAFTAPTRRRNPLLTRIAAFLIRLAPLIPLLAACQTIDATGERHLSFIGRQQEIEMGETSNEDIVRTMGLYQDESLQHYVQQIGSAVAATTERPELPWTFQVIDDNAVNAFALPGGYIYLTRGILAHFENEAQLIGVLAHEIAHVTAKHAIIRLSTSMATQLGLGIATIAVPELRDFSSMLNQGMQLLFLKFSRDDETEADRLGVRYMLNVNENPVELIDVMAMLERVSANADQGRLPQWASTHPLPENRIDFIESILAELPPGNYKDVRRSSYLQHVDGMIYGDNPREGFSKNGVFYHPGLAFQIAFPGQWRIVNEKRAVVAVSPKRDAVVQLTLYGNQEPRQALERFANHPGVEILPGRGTDINDLPAVRADFQARAKQGTIAGSVVFITLDGKLFQLVGYSPQRDWQTYRRPITETMYSFRRLNNNRYLGVEPLRLKVVTLGDSLSLRALHARYRVDIPLEELARLNQVGENEVFAPHSSVKIVTGTLP